MIKKLFFAVSAVLFYSNVNAQLIVASPGTDAQIQAQTLLMSQLAFQEQIKEYQYYLEYISQFMEVIASVRNTTSTIREISKTGSKLKNMSASDWLEEVTGELTDVMPGFEDIKDELTVAGKKIVKGGYHEYVSKWDAKTRNYHEQLVKNYENHVMFPELYPSSSKLKEGLEKSESAQKIVHKAWVESGLEYEMKDDVVRKNVFKKYYDEYMKQARSNDNIEALGLANIMQAGYLSAEALEHLKKNSDITAIREQFEKDAQSSYREMIRKLLEMSEKKDPGHKKGSVFGLDGAGK